MGHAVGRLAESVVMNRGSPWGIEPEWGSRVCVKEEDEKKANKGNKGKKTKERNTRKNLYSNMYANRVCIQIALNGQLKGNGDQSKEPHKKWRGAEKGRRGTSLPFYSVFASAKLGREKRGREQEKSR